MSKPLFKIDDVVWNCKKDGPYSITDYHRKCRVISKGTPGIILSFHIREGDPRAIAIELLEKHPQFNNTKFIVDSDYFELVEGNNDLEEEWV